MKPIQIHFSVIECLGVGEIPGAPFCQEMDTIRFPCAGQRSGRS
jgi:hypothetical protein